MPTEETTRRTTITHGQAFNAHCTPYEANSKKQVANTKPIETYIDARLANMPRQHTRYATPTLQSNTPQNVPLFQPKSSAEGLALNMFKFGTVGSKDVQVWNGWF